MTQPPIPMLLPRSVVAASATSAASKHNTKWMWENDVDGAYNYFDEDLNNLLEIIYNCNCNHKPSTPFIIPYKIFRWEFDFNTMTQKNLDNESPQKIIRIIRVENNMVWIFYPNGNQQNFAIIHNADGAINLNMLTKFGDTWFEMNKKTFDYNKNGVAFRCEFAETQPHHPYRYQCSNNIEIDKVDVNTLQSLAAAKRAPVALHLGWVMMVDPDSKRNYYVDTRTNVSSWEPPKPPSGYETRTLEGKLYFYNPITNASVWAGGKIEKKKKRFIKRNKTYKKKRYIKR